MSSNAELYGAMPLAGNGPGLSAPLKTPNPWSTLYPYAPGKLPRYAAAPGDAPNGFHLKQIASNENGMNGDNLTEMTSLLKGEFPAAKNDQQMMQSLVDSYDAPGTYRLSPYKTIPKDKVFSTMGNTISKPSAEDMKDPEWQNNIGDARRFGSLAHELRHANAHQNADGFMARRDANGRQQFKDYFGNQPDHFPGGFSDRDETNALRVLKMSHTNPIPDYIRNSNPWIPRDRQPNIDDLMQYIGSQPGYKP